jgi:hypothetical protein
MCWSLVHLILSFSNFIPLFNRISRLCGCVSYPYLIKFQEFANNSPGGDEASNEGCNSGSTGHDFTDN